MMERRYITLSPLLCIYKNEAVGEKMKKFSKLSIIQVSIVLVLCAVCVHVCTQENLCWCATACMCVHECACHFVHFDILDSVYPSSRNVASAVGYVTFHVFFKKIFTMR